MSTSRGQEPRWRHGCVEGERRTTKSTGTAEEGDGATKYEKDFEGNGWAGQAQVCSSPRAVKRVAWTRVRFHGGVRHGVGVVSGHHACGRAKDVSRRLCDRWGCFSW
jgi:hypothetical protein